MNAITPRTASTAVASLMTLKQGLANVANTIPASGGDPYLRMLTDGQWVFGADDIEVADNDTWAVNIFSVMHGYVCWTNHEKDARGKQQKNEKLGDEMVPSNEPKPLKSELHDYGWPWTDAVSFMMKATEGENVGEQVLYNTSSKGGLGAAQKLLDAITKQLDDDIEHPVPLVKLSNDTYNHSTYGRTYVPIFEIVGWATLDGAAEATPAPEPEPAKPTRTRKASVPEVKPVLEVKSEPTKQPEHETVAQAVEQTLHGETPMQKMRRELAKMEAEEARLLAAEKSKTETPPAQSAGEPEIRRRRRSA